MVVLNRIYTRTGDDGTTALGSGERRPKYDLRVAAYGTIDETNAVAGVAGTVMGTVPIDSLQIRFVTDPTGADNPAQFTMVNSITVCDTLIPATLREVRMQIVSRTANWDLQGQSTEKKINYATPGYEGTTPTPGAGGVTQDSYPRRAFNLAVVPRTLQGYRL